LWVLVGFFYVESRQGASYFELPSQINPRRRGKETGRSHRPWGASDRLLESVGARDAAPPGDCARAEQSLLVRGE